MADPTKPEHSESVAGRWSRLKQDARASGESEPDAATDEQADDAPASVPPTDATDQDDVVAALPPIESLTADSDFKPFLDRAVPAELRRLALRKLWLSDPVFANLDGLNDYDDDFRTLGVGKVVRTAYEVGKGMVTRAEKAAEAAEKTELADALEAAEEDTERQSAANENDSDPDDPEASTES